MKLHLGCGKHVMEGWENIDIWPSAQVVLDLELGHLPYERDSVDEIRAIDVLEHIRNLIPLMNECWRVLEKGGSFYIEVPRFPTDAAVADPTHVRFFVEESFNYFTKYPHIHELYGIKPWQEIGHHLEENRIFITLTPQK